MPIIVRRRLQAMLNELGPFLTPSKASDLLKRIENRITDQAIPAEYELMLTWALSKVAHVEVERKFGGRALDIYTSDLLPSAPSAIEVTAISDDSLGDQSLMRRAANIINAAASKIQKRAREHLYYEFLEESGVRPADPRSGPYNRHFRRRRVTRDFQVSSALDQALREWLRNAPPSSPLRWEDGNVGVLITWKDYVHPHANTFSSMPPVCYDVRDNPLYEALRAKARQLRSVPDDILRGIFIGDAGCSLLWTLGRPFGGAREVRGDEIFRTFVQRHPEIDFIIAFVPRRRQQTPLSSRTNPREWHLFVYSGELGEEEFEKVTRTLDLLPKPYLEGYQARSWHQQGDFDLQARGRYLGATWTSTAGRNGMTAKFSARALQDLLAGRITPEQFQHRMIGNPNLFEVQLRRGMTISNARFEHTGDENDDDYIILEFS